MPAHLPFPLNLFCKIFLAESRSADKAKIHFKISPGGSTPSSSRNLPVEPPESTIDTTAETSIPSISRKAQSKLNCPVPPR